MRLFFRSKIFNGLQFFSRFLCKDTIEMRVKQLQAKKLKLCDEVITGSSSTKNGNKIDTDDIKELLDM